MIFIDASVILAYDNENDVHHKKAAAIFQELEGKNKPYFISDYILNEVVGVTLRKCGKERAITLGEHLLKTMLILNVDDHLLQESWKLFQSTTALNLSLVDCTSIVIIQLTNNRQIATFDKEFKKIEGINVLDRA